MVGGITGNKILSKERRGNFLNEQTLDPGENPGPRNPVPSCPVLIEPRFCSQPTTFISLFLYQPPQLDLPYVVSPAHLPALLSSYLPRSEHPPSSASLTTHIVGLSLRVVNAVAN